MRGAATCLLLFAIAATAARPVRAQSAPPRRVILVIVAASSPVNELSLEELRRIFTGAARELRPLNLPPGTPERIGLDFALLGRAPDDVARYWMERKIRGQGGPPRAIPTARLVAKIVARLPGTIGYVAEGPLPEGVKAIRIAGLSHTDARYPLLLRGRQP